MRSGNAKRKWEEGGYDNRRFPQNQEEIVCIIMHCRRKDLLKEKELREAMKANPAGFFLAALYKDKDGVPKRDVVRTMDEKEAVDFWKKQPDDREMVMHFRIPSRGMDRTVANVHGWEEDGILMAHNMTIHQIDGMMSRVKWKGTDSEFFFRKVFIPMYRGLGGNGKAYADGKFCEDLDNIVRFFCGNSNRFCFVMPDNAVIRYGDWTGSDATRKVGDEPGFFASNSSYRVFERAWPEKGGAGAGAASGFRGGYGIVGYEHWATSQMGKAVQGQEEAEEDECTGAFRGTGRGPEVLPHGSLGEDEYDGRVAVELLGPQIVLRLALADVVVSNYMSLVKQMKLRSEGEIAVLESLRPRWFTAKTSEAAFEAVTGVNALCSEAVRDAMLVYAAELESQLGKYFPGAAYPPQKIERQRVRDHYNELAKEVDVFCRMAFIDLNWRATDAEDFLHIFTLEHSKRKNRPFVDEILPDDIFVPETMKSEDALDSVGNVLKAVKLMEKGYDVDDIDVIAP